MPLFLRGGHFHGSLGHWGSLRSETHGTGDGRGGCPVGILDPELVILGFKMCYQWPWGCWASIRGIIEYALFPEPGYPDRAGPHLPEPQASAGERSRAGEVPAAGR